MIYYFYIAYMLETLECVLPIHYSIFSHDDHYLFLFMVEQSVSTFISLRNFCYEIFVI